MQDRAPPPKQALFARVRERDTFEVDSMVRTCCNSNSSVESNRDIISTSNSHSDGEDKQLFATITYHANSRFQNSLAKPQHNDIGVLCLSHANMMSVITRGASHETSSCCSPLPSHNILQCHTTRVGGSHNSVAKHTCYDSANMFDLTHILVASGSESLQAICAHDCTRIRRSCRAFRKRDALPSPV